MTCKKSELCSNFKSYAVIAIRRSQREGLPGASPETTPPSPRLTSSSVRGGSFPETVTNPGVPTFGGSARESDVSRFQRRRSAHRRHREASQWLRDEVRNRRIVYVG